MRKPLQEMINRHIENTHIILLTDGEDWSKDKVIQFGGHELAAGMSLEEDKIDEFIENAKITKICFF